MKERALVIICLSLLFLCSLTATKYSINIEFGIQYQETQNSVMPSEGLYEESPPIVISNNSDFADQAMTNLWDGNGSISDPYIIEGLNITTIGASAIHIGNTTVFFEIAGCFILGGTAGIFLENVTHAKIWNTTIRYSESRGILVSESDDVKVTNNTIVGMSGADSTGLYSLGSHYCEFSNNTIEAVLGWDILIDYSHNCSITHNYLSTAYYDGIRLRDSSENNITLNEIAHSRLSGIKLGNSHKCRIEQNIVEYSEGDGISIEASSSCMIEENVVHESGYYSLDLAGDTSDIVANTFYKSQIQGLRIQSDSSLVTHNNFIENNLAFTLFSSYIADVGLNNDISGNYYDVWTWPDEDENDIVDRPYSYGDEEIDPEPHVKVFQTNLMHILTKPRLIYPNETIAGEKFWDQIQLSWTIASDTFGHDATYNVSVSTNGGSSWIQLAQNLIDTNLDWNSSEFSESTEYRFRVVAQCTEGLVSEYITNAEYEVKIHTLSVPTVLTPNGGETIVGEYGITWTESVESWDLLVSYDVYYSSDAGGTWTEIINSYENTSIIWGARGLPEGDQYLIRVVARGSSGIVAEDVSDSVFSVRWSSNTIIVVLVGSGVVLLVIAVYALRRRGTI
ncbi:MAG: right-handed parallel beta-helix repeat-containing protein [Promethearchaeota archaeon]